MIMMCRRFKTQTTLSVQEYSISAKQIFCILFLNNTCRWLRLCTVAPAAFCFSWDTLHIVKWFRLPMHCDRAQYADSLEKVCGQLFINCSQHLPFFLSIELQSLLFVFLSLKEAPSSFIYRWTQKPGKGNSFSGDNERLSLQYVLWHHTFHDIVAIVGVK